MNRTPPTAANSRARRAATHPLVPAVTAVAVALAGVAVSWAPLTWAGLAGAAGYALSGSV